MIERLILHIKKFTAQQSEMTKESLKGSNPLNSHLSGTENCTVAGTPDAPIECKDRLFSLGVVTNSLDLITDLPTPESTRTETGIYLHRDLES